MKFTADTRLGSTVRLPPSVQTVAPNAVTALTERRDQRLRELGSWQPSKGWLTNPDPSRGNFAGAT
jgi:hypothetical protein